MLFGCDLLEKVIDVFDQAAFKKKNKHIFQFLFRVAVFRLGSLASWISERKTKVFFF